MQKWGLTMKKKIIITITSLCILLLCIGGILSIKFIKKSTLNAPDTVGNTTGNLYNNGYFCESDDGYVYFSNAYDSFSLYRMLPDETDMQKLVSTETKSINAAGKYFYYYRSGSGTGTGLGYMFNTTGIYRANSKNGENGLCLDMTPSDNILLIGNTVYYNSEKNGNSIHTVSTDGKDKSTLLPYNITFGSVQNGKLYFTDGIENFHLKALDLTTNTVSDILAEDIYLPIIDGNDLYCIDIHNNYALVQYDMTTWEKTILDETRTDFFNLSSQYVYYQTSGDNPQFKRISRTSHSIDIIADGAYSDINLTSKYVYFHEYNVNIPVYKIPLDGDITISTFDAAKTAVIDSISN